MLHKTIPFLFQKKVINFLIKIHNLMPLKKAYSPLLICCFFSTPFISNAYADTLGNSNNNFALNKSNQSFLPVENIPTPPPSLPRTFTETAITYSSLSPKGRTQLFESESFDMSQAQSVPVLGAQVQRWFFRDYENSQHLGYILGMGLGDKKINVTLKDRPPLSNVEIIYMRLMAGLSLERAFLNDRLYLGMHTLLIEELWQQNAPELGSQWSQWNPALGISFNLKGTITQRWYGLAEFHNHMPLRQKVIETNNQRIYLGVGYCL